MLKRADDRDDPTDPVSRIWDAIESCDGERALDLALRLEADDDDYEAALAVAVAHLEADLYPEAEKLLVELGDAPLAEEDESQRLWFLGQTVLSLGRPDEALDILSNVKVMEPADRADVEWWRGLCHDHRGAGDAADRCFMEATRLDENLPTPASISPDEAQRVVSDVVAKLPDELKRAFKLAAGQPICKGFAVGRSVFQAPAEMWFSGAIGDQQVIEQVRKNYARLVQLWAQRSD